MLYHQVIYHRYGYSVPLLIGIAKRLGTNVQGSHLAFVVNTVLKDVNKYGFMHISGEQRRGQGERKLRARGGSL